MANTILIKRGNKANLGNAGALPGELKYALDTQELFIGNGAANVQIGGNPLNFPISTATKSALDLKANKPDVLSAVSGTMSSGSSGTAFTLKQTKNGVTTNVGTIPYSEKVSGTYSGGIMTGLLATKLDGIELGANKTVVDASLSSTSTNPVLNKVINLELLPQNLLNKIKTVHGVGSGLDADTIHQINSNNLMLVEEQHLLSDDKVWVVFDINSDEDWSMTTIVRAYMQDDTVELMVSGHNNLSGGLRWSGAKAHLIASSLDSIEVVFGINTYTDRLWFAIPMFPGHTQIAVYKPVSGWENINTTRISDLFTITQASDLPDGVLTNITADRPLLKNELAESARYADLTTNADYAQKSVRLLNYNTGSISQPTYFSDGLPAVCTPYSEASVKYADDAGTASTAVSARYLKNLNNLYIYRGGGNGIILVRNGEIQDSTYNIGTTTRPVYLSNGKITACSRDIPNVTNMPSGLVSITATDINNNTTTYNFCVV